MVRSGRPLRQHPRRTGGPGRVPYRGGMKWILLIIALVAVAYVFRVVLLSKVLGQSEARTRRALERRKRS